MTIPTIFETCRPRADVLKGAITESDFAADLAQVILGAGNVEYLDPARFFANTYPTRGLKNLLANVCRRLSGAGGEVTSIFRLDTSYGGGKSHGLIALCHAARGMQSVSDIAEFVDPSLLPQSHVRIAAFDGENSDPANGRRMEGGILAYTPWGEIAYALAGEDGYARVRKSDEIRIAPGAETLRELFGGEPTLILLDELSVYLRKVHNLEDARTQLTAFLTSLFKAVEGAPNAALVYTLAIGKDGRATDAYNEENQFIADNMAEAESVSARKATLLNPTEEDETVQVLRRRLFESIDETKVLSVTDSYRALWGTNKESLSDDADRPETVETFRSSYPLHPEVLETLTGKTATLGNFQAGARHAAAVGAHDLASLGGEARGRDRDSSSPYRSGLRTDPPGDRDTPRADCLRTGHYQRYRCGIGREESAGAGDRRRASRWHATVCGLRCPHHLHAYARLQRSAQGNFTGAVALFGTGSHNGHQLYRGGAHEIHRRVRLPGRPPRRADALSRRGQSAPDHPP